MLDETHDPAATSWVESANRESGFPIQNLPFASFRPRGSDEDFRIGVAIGDEVLDLRRCEGLPDAEFLATSSLNAFMGLGHGHLGKFRRHLSRALRAGAPEADRWREHLVPRDAVEH